MTLPRFYQIEVLDGAGETRRLAVDLVDRRLPLDPAQLVRSMAATLPALDANRRARTAYVDIPAAGSAVEPLSAYAWGDGTPNTGRFRRHLEALHVRGALHRYIVRTGSWAEGADLVGRESVLAELGAKLRAAGHVHLMAPRRYGKTSILRALQDRFTQDGRAVIRIDVESVDTVAGLVVRLVDEAFQVTDALRGIDGLHAWPTPEAGALALSEACRTLHERIRTGPLPVLTQACAALARANAIVLADEFTRFVLETMPGEQRTTFVRALEAIAATPGLGILVCGSQGLRGFIEWHDLQPLRELGSVAVGPLEPDIAETLVEELFYGEGYSPAHDAIAAVLDAVGAPIPYFLHGLVHHAIQDHRNGKRRSGASIDRATVDRAYERRLLDQEGNEFFRAFRLKERGYPDAIRKPAATALRLLAQSAEELPLDTLRAGCGLPPESFELLLAALVEDYDVVQDEQGARFRSKVMRERWARREAWLRGGGE
ncbi:MAG: hypothetical protein HY898_21530 [Deltaproteobacteria bacterium]|nr:hypothetical protein [Deltaproteobacteria bacterium]